MSAQSPADGAGGSPPPSRRSSASAALAAEVRDGLSRRRRELPGRFLSDRAIAATRRTVEQIVDARLHRVERPLLRAWIDEEGSARALRRLVDLIPSGATTALVLFDAPATRVTLRDCVVVEETADVAHEGAARCAAASPECTAVPMVANPTMTIPVARYAVTCFTLFGSALMRFSPVAAVRVLRAVRAAMTNSDVLLLGLDLRSPEARQQHGDEHAELLTAWHRHALTVANRELGMDFPVQNFRYQCCYDDVSKRLEEGVTCIVHTRVASPIMETLILRPGAHLRTALQHSYGRAMLEPMLHGVGLSLAGWRESADGSHALATAVVSAPTAREP